MNDTTFPKEHKIPYDTVEDNDEQVEVTPPYSPRVAVQITITKDKPKYFARRSAAAIKIRAKTSLIKLSPITCT
jgi:hypothetical protein